MKFTGETEELREETRGVERQDVLTGIPQSEVVIFKEEGVGPLGHMLEVAEIIPIEGALEQTLQKGLLTLNGISFPPVGVIVERLEVVKCSRVLVEEVASKGGAAPPGCQQEDLPGVFGRNDVSYSV